MRGFVKIFIKLDQLLDGKIMLESEETKRPNVTNTSAAPSRTSDQECEPCAPYRQPIH